MPTDGAASATELAAHGDAEARMAAALVELERHPAHEALAAGTCTGVTAERWSAAGAALAGLWEDFATFRSVLDEARARPVDRDRLLREASVLTGDGDKITLVALTARMDAALREVSDVVEVVDATHRAVFAALVPLAERARAALATARELDPEGADTVRLAGALADVERALVHDPLALADRPVEDVLAPVAAAVEPVVVRCAQLAAVRDGWAQGLVELEAALAAAESLRDEADRAGRRAQELIADAPPIEPDPLPALRAQFAALPGIAGWPARAVAVQDLRAAVTSTTAALRTAADAAAELVDRRGELRGRFDAYQAKATRLGVAERADVLAAYDRVRDLLWTRPCDLAAATVAVVDYQRLVRDGG